MAGLRPGSHRDRGVHRRRRVGRVSSLDAVIPHRPARRRPRRPARCARSRPPRAAEVDALIVSPGVGPALPDRLRRAPPRAADGAGAAGGRGPRLVVPGLEAPAAVASPVGALGLEILAWDETDDPYALVAARSSARSAVVALDNHMWAEKALAPAGRHAGRRASCSPARCCASCGCASRATRSSRCGAPARRSTGCTHQVAAVAAGRAHRARGRRRHRRRRSWPRDTCGVDFVIVGSGPNGASPHHELSDRMIEAGDPVVVDIGGTMPDGYCSDCTRTYSVGRAARRSSREYYGVLLAAQQAACAHVRPGVTCRERRRRRPRRHRSRRLRRALLPPHRPWHRPRDARGALHRRGQHRAARAGHGVLASSRASTCAGGTAPASRTSSCAASPTASA